MAGTKMIISPMTDKEKKVYDEKIAAMSDEDRVALFADIAEKDKCAVTMIEKMRADFGRVTLRCVQQEDIKKFLFGFELVLVNVHYAEGLITLQLRDVQLKEPE